MDYLINVLITVLIIYIGYNIIKYYHTEYEYTTLEILKDIQNPLIKNKIVNKELKIYDYISLNKEEKFIFGKLKSSKLYISKGFYNDFDDDWS